MSLEEQIFTVPLAQGLNTKGDAKTLGASLTSVSNAVLKKTNRLSKRSGFEQLPTETSTASNIDGRALATFGDELLHLSDNRLFSYSTSRHVWLDRGPSPSVSVGMRRLVQTQKSSTTGDSAILDGVILTAYSNPVAGQPLLCRLEDVETGAIISEQIALAHSGSNCRVITFQDKFVVIYCDPSGVNIYGATIDPATGSLAQATIATDLYDAEGFDAVNFNDNKIAIIYIRIGDIKYGWLDATLAFYTGSFAAKTISGGFLSVACALTPGSTLTIAYNDGPNTISYAVYSASFAVLKAPTVIGSSAASKITIGSIGNTAYLFFNDFGILRDTINKCTIDMTTFVASAITLFRKNASLASKAFTRQGMVYVGTIFVSDVQSTFFLIDKDGVIVSKHQPGTAAACDLLPNIVNVGETYYWPILYKTRLISSTGSIYSLLGLALATIAFEDNSNFSAVELGGNLHIVGGFLSMYDGVSVAEHGFHLFPEFYTPVLTGSTGVPIGNYLYVAIYEWTDAKGNVHRSAPSVAKAVAVTGSAKNVAIPIVPLTMTAKAGASQVSIVLFRTPTNQTGVFYRVSSVTAPTYNDVTVLDVTITDTLTDAAIFSNEILYTSGGVLENIAPPACKYICVYKNRIILAGLEDNTLAFSKTWTLGGPVEFAQEFMFGVDSEGGNVTSIETLDDRLFIFKQDRFAYTYGEGPNDLGAGSYFPTPVAVPSDVGCIDQQSIVNTTEGLIFKSAKGFYILRPQSLASDYVGAPVEDYNDLSITSATLKSDVNQVRFTHSDGVCLTYDYFFKQWYKFQNSDAYDGLIWKNRFAFLRSSPRAVQIEDPTIFRDGVTDSNDGDPVYLSLETGWIALGDVSGFQRVKRFSLLADYLSSHMLKISIGFDFEPQYDADHEVLFNSNTDLDPTKYNQTLLGSLNLKGGAGIPYRIEGHIGRQKCQSIRFKIEEFYDYDPLDPDSLPPDGSGEGLSLTSIGLLFGIKRGLGKYVNKKLGAS